MLGVQLVGGPTVVPLAPLLKIPLISARAVNSPATRAIAAAVAKTARIFDLGRGE